MYCPDCKKDYNKEEQAWRFIGIGVAFEGLYILESDVYFAEILAEILNDAIGQKLTTICIDTYAAECAPCAGCQLLSLRERASRAELLENSKYSQLYVYESY